MENNQEIIPLSPVTEWNFSSIPALDAIYVEFAYLSSPMQKMEEAHLSQRFLFQKQQLVELRNTIDRILQQHEKSGFQPVPPNGLQS